MFSKKHSDILKDAFKVRNKSDYDIHYIVVKAEVVEQHANAKVFLSAVEEYLSTL